MDTHEEFISTLGEGSSGIVSLYKIHSKFLHITVSTLVAVKYSKSSQAISQERTILRHFRGCPQIIQRIHDYHKYPNHLYLEFAPQGTLSSLLSSSGPLPLPQVLTYTTSLLKGLAHIHKNRYVHSDLKPDNILVWTETDIKIANFGLAKRTREKPKGTTPMYMAPECVTRYEYEAPMDIWALGCTVVEMITGREAMKYDDANVKMLARAIAEGKAYPEIPEELSEVGKHFLSKCFKREPERRWTAEMLLLHPFLDHEGNCNRSSSTSTSDSNSADDELDAAMRSYYEYIVEFLGI